MVFHAGTLLIRPGYSRRAREGRTLCHLRLLVPANQTNLVKGRDVHRSAGKESGADGRGWSGLQQ
jgi:hypothetical protein